MTVAADPIGRWRERAEAADRADPLTPVRSRFTPGPRDTIYWDGNSLGRPPGATAGRVDSLVRGEWAQGLVGSWARWLSLPTEMGDLIAPLVGAGGGEVVVCDSVSVNLFKVADALVGAHTGHGGVGYRPDIVVSEDDFPTNRFVLAEVAARAGGRVRLIPSTFPRAVTLADIGPLLDDRVGVVALSLVDFRSAAVCEGGPITAAVREAGASMVWDLCHAAGAVEVELGRWGAHAAVGCTYKYLCGGPGAPAFVWMAEGVAEGLRSPVAGWWGEADQFAMGPQYRPRRGVARFLAGTPPVVSMIAALPGIEEANRAGMAALAAAGRSLTGLFIEVVEDRLVGHGLTLASPRTDRERGAHVALVHPEAWQITQELGAAGVIADFREPDVLRCGLAPLTTSHGDVVEGLVRLDRVMSEGSYRSRPSLRSGLR